MNTHTPLSTLKRILTLLSDIVESLFFPRETTAGLKTGIAQEIVDKISADLEKRNSN